MGAVTKTLELKLVDPNVHKRQKLRETRDAYQRALQEAFTAGCDTQSAVNDAVVEYDLSGYAKNALKQYVPQLHTSYDTDELHDDHPVRFTNEGLQLDHQPQNAIGWYVKIPHHEDYTSGYRHAPIPNSGSGSKRCTQTTLRWAKVGCLSGTERGISTSPPPETWRTNLGRPPTSGRPSA